MNPRKDKAGREEEGELTPLAAFLPGFVDSLTVEPPTEPVKPLTPQKRHHFTVRKQIEELIAIPQDSPEMGFMTRLLTLCSLPRTDPGARTQYKRENGPYKLIMIAGGDNKLPFGTLPRLLLAWVCTEAVRTQGRDLQLGHSLAQFMRELGMNSDSGGATGNRTRLRTQIDRLFSSTVELTYAVPGYKKALSSLIADERELWWDYKQPAQDTLWQSRIRLGEKLFNEIVENPVPLDMRILKAMRRSSLGLDLYMWLSYKTFSLLNSKGAKVQQLSWHQLYAQFGKDPSKASDKDTVNDFRKEVLRELKKLRLCWPSLDYGTPKGYLEVRGCRPSVPPRQIAAKGQGTP
jgi:Plasmid encoded RepA protein